MITMLLKTELADNNWIILIGLLAAVLGIIDFFTNHKIFKFIRNAFIIKNQGIIPSRFLKYKKKIDGEVFAIELLVEDIVIKKNLRGDNSVIINRDNVKHALINNSGKKRLYSQYAQDYQERLRRLENEIQVFLLQPFKVEENEYVLSLKNLPLRWASGGVLSIINYKGRKWIPMFFRDIPPYGWNISLGSSERSFVVRKPDHTKYENELNSPINYIEREFLEETLVLTGSPKENNKCSAKYFISFTNLLDDNALLQTQNYNDHIKLRQDYDKFDINFNKENYIAPRLHPSNMEVKVKKDKKVRTTRDIFICFNLLELGIEVVKVIGYDLDENDCMLDGEVLEKDGKLELVRMPIALISLDYLTQEFSISENESYTIGVPPSIEAKRKMNESDVVLFDWDIRQRYNIIEGGKEGIGSELDRYIDWNDKFHDYFRKDSRGHISTSNLPAIFTPATIKIFKQYTALLNR
jgi:hypothetical protein